jgi:galactonate dehydratase
VKIVDVRTTVVGAPWRELTFVELETDAGLVGLGEVRMVNKTETLLACIGELAPRYVVGADPFDVERLAWNVQVAEYGRPGEVAMSALAAFDVACWDLIGQALRVPVWKLLGGALRDRVPAYANGWYHTGRDPAAMADAARAVVERGYLGLKLDPFGAAYGRLTRDEFRLSVRIVEAVREAVGPDVEVMIEMHGRFTPHAAVELARALRDLDPAWLEEPIPPDNPAALRRVRAGTDLPIATGERVHTLGDCRELVEDGCVDILQADLTHFGGFTQMKGLARWAGVHHVELAPHNVCGPVATTANLHLAACTPNFRVLEHFNDFSDPWVAELVDEAPTVSAADGCFPIPSRPGLGVALDHDVCAAHPRTGGLVTLFEPGWERRGQRGHAAATQAATPPQNGPASDGR